MATWKTCKDCLHFEDCSHIGRYQKFITNNKPSCFYFKDRSRIIEPLCNVGDTVWMLDDGEKFTFKSKVDEIRILSGNRISYHFENAYDWFETSDFGKIVFLSEEAAEQIIGGNKV